MSFERGSGWLTKGGGSVGSMQTLGGCGHPVPASSTNGRRGLACSKQGTLGHEKLSENRRLAPAPQRIQQMSCARLRVQHRGVDLQVVDSLPMHLPVPGPNKLQDLALRTTRIPAGLAPPFDQVLFRTTNSHKPRRQSGLPASGRSPIPDRNRAGVAAIEESTPRFTQTPSLES